MGSTFVGIGGRGFWMRDGVLELWLRLLALHLAEPGDAERPTSPIPAIRDGWLLASKGYFTGCVPHGLEEAIATAEGRRVVLAAIDSLLEALRRAPPDLDRGVLNLLGFDGGEWLHDFEAAGLIEVGTAWIDLIEGRIDSGPSDSSLVPGSR